MTDKKEAIGELKDRLQNADSIAEDVPVLSELFHEARTAGRRQTRGHGGRFVALLDYDGEWTCRHVNYLQGGTHYRGTGADLKLSCRPYPFMEIDMFKEWVGWKLREASRYH